MPPRNPREQAQRADHGEHQRHRDDAWRAQVTQRVDVEQIHRVDLLGDPHGAQLGGDRGRHARADHHGAEGGNHLAGVRDEGNARYIVLRAELDQLHAGLEDHHHADKDAGEGRDGERLDPDGDALRDDHLPSPGGCNGALQDGPGEAGVIADKDDELNRPRPDHAYKVECPASNLCIFFHGLSLENRPQVDLRIDRRLVHRIFSLAMLRGDTILGWRSTPDGSMPIP
jgi:hypothetical protein